MKGIIAAFWFLCISLGGYSQIHIYEHFQFYTPSNVNVMEFSPNGRFLSIGTDKKGISLYDTNAKKIFKTFESNSPVTGLLFDLDNQYLISAHQNRTIQMWDLYSGQIVNTINKDFFRENIIGLTIAPDNKLLLVSTSKTISLFELQTLSLYCKLENGHKDDIVFSSFTRNGDQVFSVSADNLVVFWNFQIRKPAKIIEIKPNTLTNSGVEILCANTNKSKQLLAIGLEERKLATGGNRMIFKQLVALYSLQSMELLKTIEDNNSELRQLFITPDNKYCLTNNSTLNINQLSLWDMSEGKIYINSELTGKINRFTLSEEGKWLSVACKRNSNDSSLISIKQISGFESYNYQVPHTIAATPGFNKAIKFTTSRDPVFGIGENNKIAVINFDQYGMNQDGLSRTITVLLESKLANSPSLSLIERNQIDKVIEESKFQLSGLTQSDAVKIGEILNAKYIILGSINKLGNRLILSTKVINVETSQITASREVQCDNASLDDISDMINILAPSLARF